MSAAAAAAPDQFRAVGVTVGYPSLPLADTLALAEQAEAAGLGLLGAGEGFAENCSVMGALSARTRTPELFTSVIGWTRSPVTTALAATTLQELAGNRYRLGIGAMPRRWSEEWHDVEQAKPVARMRDYVAAIRAAWRSQPGLPVSHEGPYYRFTDYERLTPLAQEPPPLYLGVTLPRMTELVGEVADGAVFNTMTSATWLRDVSLPALARGLAAAGRVRADVDLGRLLYCAVADTRAEALALVRPSLAFYLEIPYFGEVCERHGFEAELARGRAALARGDVTAAAASIGDEMVDAFALAGTPDEVRERIGAYAGLLDWIMLAVPLGHDEVTTRALAQRIVATFAAPAAA